MVSSVNYVVTLFDHIFTNPGSITIDLGYGEIEGMPMGSDSIGESDIAYADWSYESYSSVRSALTSIHPSIVMPASTPYGAETVAMTSTEAKALGFVNAGSNLGIPDGYVGISNSIPLSYGLANPTISQYYLIGVLEHEITEVMGRTSYFDPFNDPEVLDLFRYNQSTLGSSAPALSLDDTGSIDSYFSTDGGVHDLANYSLQSDGDAGDWASLDEGGRDNVGNDAFLAVGTSGLLNVMSAVDFQEMQALGFSTADTFIGQGQNIGGNADLDVFLRSGNNQLGAVEVNGSNNAATVLFLNANGSALLIGSTATIVSNATNELGAGGGDIGLKDSFGVTSIYELNGAGVVVAASLTGGSGADYLQLFGNGTMAGGGGGNALDASAAIAGTRQLIVSTSRNDTIWAGAGTTSISGATGSNQLVFGNFNSPGSMIATLGGGATVDSGLTSATVNAGTGSVIYGNISTVNDGSLVIEGANASTVNPGISDTTVAGGASDLVYGSFNRVSRLTVTNVNNSVINAGLSTTTINNGSGDIVYGDFGTSSNIAIANPTSATIAAGLGTMSISGGNGNTLYGNFGGTSGDALIAVIGSNNHVFAAVGASTITATGSGDLIYGNYGTNPGPLVVSVTGGNDSVYAGRASATISGADETSANTYIGGTGAQSIMAGAGNDILYAGSGNTTLTGGSGNDVFVFVAGVAAGAVMINDFTAHDSGWFSGYGSSEVSYAFSHETVGASSTTMTLSDGTQVTFNGVTKLNQIQFGAG